MRHPSGCLVAFVRSAFMGRPFSGYADYMQTRECQTAVEHLVSMAARTTFAIMCAEAVPWRCHRSLIADALIVGVWM